MPRVLRSQLPLAPYHVVAHAVEGGVLFRHDADRRHYLELLRGSAARADLRFLSFVLMTNHVHLLVWASGPALSATFQRAHGRFADLRNADERRGALFEGRFRSFMIDSERYLYAVLRYIALNPVKAGMCATPGDHPWSAHRPILGQAPAVLPLDESRLVELLGGHPEAARAAYASLVDGPPSPDEDAIARWAEQPPVDRPPLAELLRDPDEVAMFLAHEVWRYSLAEIARALGIHRSTALRRVAAARRR